MGGDVSATVADALWRRYRETGDPETRAQLLDRYLGLVYHVARGIHQRVHHTVEFGDLVSAGTIGLVGALETFDLERGLAFSTFATQRIRGAMLDELRGLDERPRSVRERRRRLERATEELEGALGRAPEPREVAERLDVDLETYWRWREDAVVGESVAYDSPQGPEGGTPADRIGDPEAVLPDEWLQREETVAQLRAAIAALPVKARTVLTLYYYEHLNQRAIAEVLHVTESRVSQIRSEAIRMLRRKLLADVEDRP